jgi:hypothetical protein
MSSRALARALAPLAGHPTIRHFRYSGSLIGDLLRSEADYAELDAFGHSGRNLRQVFEAIRTEVSQMEREQRFAPSQPQVWVSPDATDLYDAAKF